MFSSQKIHFFLVFQESSPFVFSPSDPQLQRSFLLSGAVWSSFAKVAKWPKFRQCNSKSGIKIRLYDIFYCGTLPWGHFSEKKDSKCLGFWTLLSWTYFLWRQSYNNIDEKIKLTVGKDQKNLIFRQWLDFLSEPSEKNLPGVGNMALSTRQVQRSNSHWRI